MGKVDYFRKLTRISGYIKSNFAPAAGIIINKYNASITIQRAGTTLPAQSVRIDVLTNTSLEGLSESNEILTDRMRVVVTGTKGHPTITDIDIQRGDLFYYDGNIYEVIHVYPQTKGIVQAMAEVRSG